MHPAFQDLSIAMRLLQSIGRPLMRLIVLQHSEHEDDQEKGLVGNTVLLSQPTPKEVILKLPPPEDDFQDYFSVVFNTSAASAMSREEVGKQKVFTIDRKHYLKCVAICQQVCPTFAEVEIDQGACQARLPEQAVPPPIIKAAVPMDTLDTFNPTLDGPATMRAPACPLPAEDEHLEEDNDINTVATENDNANAGASEHHDINAVATEHTDASPLPLDLPAEYVIGVQEDGGDDAVNRMLAFQRQMQLVQEHGDKLCRFERQRRDLAKTCSEDAVDAASRVAAEKATHMQAFVDLSQIASRMGNDYELTMQQAITSSSKLGDPRTLVLKAGKPLDMFAAAAWAASFVEFFYGDCAPNLDRHKKYHGVNCSTT